MVRAGSIAALLTAAVTSGALAVTTAAAASPGQRPAHRSPAASGSKLWQARYTGVGGLGAFSLASAISPDGSAVFVTGGSHKKVSEGGGGADAGQTLAYRTSTGAVLWRTGYDPGHRNTSQFGAIAVSPDGSAVYVTGSTAPDTAGGQTVVTAAYRAATGTALWIDATTVRGSGEAVATSPDGTTVYVTGGGTISAVSAATGATLWTDKTTGTAVNEAVSPDGSTVFAKVISPADGDLVLAVDAGTGAAIWSDTANRMDILALAVSPDSGALFVTGAANGTPGTAGAVARTMAIDAATGATVWTRTAPGTAGGSYAKALAVSPDGTGVFVTGSSDSLAGVGTTWAYDPATGASLWQRNLADFGADAIAVSPDGSRVFTTGDGLGSSPRQVFSTAAYDPATGAVLWRQGGDRTGQDWYSFATSLGVTPDSATVIASGDVNTPAPGTKPGAVTVSYGA